MNSNAKKKFNWKAFISLYISFSFIIMIVSGVILYLAPAGRIAKWTHIYILGLEKDAWQAIHIIFTFLFIIASGFHIWYNWKPFVSYLRNKMQQKFSLRKELIASFLITMLLFVFTLLELPPFSSLIELGEDLTDSWSTEQTEPPAPHAESMTFDALAKTINKPVEGLLANLNQNNIIAQQDEIVRDVAEKYNLTPMELFKKMKTFKTTDSSSPYSGRGLGRKTMREICKTVQIDLENSLLLLKDNGINAGAEMTLKNIAGEYDMKPIDIMKIINPDKAGK